ncbi:MAG: hypothetical protein ACRDV2_14145 [Actinomycetes bacterium]
MNETVAARRSPVPVGVLLLAALLSGLLALTVPHHPAVATDGHDHGPGHSAAPRSNAQIAFHDQMRKLWEDHVTWTRLAIVSFADGSDGFDTTASRLLQNQADIGDAIKPFYGKAAGEQLTSLLSDHITIAVELLQAAQAGDTARFDDVNTRWSANGEEIADFLAAANPRFWPRDVMRAVMAGHLEQTLAEAAHELQGQYAAGVLDYEMIHEHILEMADLLSSGIMRQFPKRFH